MEDDELFELEVDSAGTCINIAQDERVTEPSALSPSDVDAPQDGPEQPGETNSVTSDATNQLPCKRPHPANDHEHDRSHKLMGTSLPIAIPMSNSLMPREPKEVADQPATFVPPHVMSQQDTAYLDGSIPEAGLRTTLLRKRNEIFRKTGFIEATVTDFNIVAPRTFTPGLDPPQDLNARRGALALALTPVPEQAASVVP